MKRNLLVAAAIASATLLMAGCMGGGKKQASDETVSGNAVTVKTDRAAVSRVARTEVFTANLKGFKEQQIIPATNQRIDRIYAEVGDKVKEGQLLVDMNKLEYITTKNSLLVTEQTRDRLARVYESGGVSKQQLDELDATIFSQKELFKNLEQNLSFRAPFAGVVTKRNFEEGDFFSMAAGVGILQIMQIEKLKAYISVSEQNFADVRTGMPVEITTDVFPGRVFEGKVSRIDPAINSMTRTFEVEVAIPNSSETLRPGMFARATLNLGEVENVTVNDMAIQHQAGTNNKYVFVAENGVAVRRPVVTGRQSGDRVEILSGVNEGDNVIVAGIARLTNGVKVEVTE